MIGISFLLLLLFQFLFNRCQKLSPQNDPLILEQVLLYDAMIAQHGICYGSVSVCVCLSVTSCYVRTAKDIVMQTMPHGSPGTLVF